MRKRIYHFISKETDAFFKFKKSERLWHVPVLAALCVGFPLLHGVFFDQLAWGSLASLAGTVILYMPMSSFSERMRSMLTCSFGFMISFCIGLVFGFHPLVGAVALGTFAFLVHWVCLYFRIRPPGSFFFIMLASIAVSIPFDPLLLPERIGLIGLGTLCACVLALIYSVLTWKKNQSTVSVRAEYLTPPGLWETGIDSGILGVSIGLSLLLGHWLHLQNPYWVPISCAAVMQAGSTYHIWQRSFQRIFGTFVGVGLCWLILSGFDTILSICLAIIVLQFIVEMLVVRNYAIAVIFITPLTILLTEAGNPLIHTPDILIPARFWNIALGSFIGAIGGWLTYRMRDSIGLSNP